MRSRTYKLVIRCGLLSIIALTLNCCSFLFSPTETTIYVVKEGDTLHKIGDTFNVAVSELKELNDIGDPRKLKVGQVLNIPVSEVDPRGSLKSKALRPEKESVTTVKLSEAATYVGKLLWPVRIGTLSSRFGKRMISFHEGVDIRAEQGTPIYAAHDGLAIYSGNGLRGYGNLIVVRGKGLLTIYAHNRTNEVRRGDSVKKGEVIAYVGKTGKASAPHLHFETRVTNKNGKHVAVDPLVFFNSSA